MASNSISRLTLRTYRLKPFTPLLTRSYRTFRPYNIRDQLRVPILLFTFPAPRTFTVSASQSGILPDSSDPPLREAEDHDDAAPTQRTQIKIEEYHQRADQFLESLLGKLEARQEEKGDIDVEYSAGVLSVDMGQKGIYVFNKQPPNKQIWLSSPLTGPKRFDWVLFSEGQHQKEGSGVGDWVYLKDSTSLTDLVKKELGVEASVDPDAEP